MAAAAVAVRSVTSFDPDGDGEEHEDEVGNLVDGNPSTTWRSSQYGGADFAGLKPGLGFVLVFDGPVALGELELVGHQPQLRRRGGGGRRGPVDPGRVGRRRWRRRRAWAADATFDLDGKTATAVLVWITNPTSTRWPSAT